MAGGTDYHEKAAHDVTKAVWRHLRALTWLQWACPGVVAAAVAAGIGRAPRALGRGYRAVLAPKWQGVTADEL